MTIIEIVARLKRFEMPEEILLLPSILLDALVDRYAKAERENKQSNWL